MRPLDLQTPSPPFAADAERWRAVQARDPQANGHFLYAVRTTGVFCRPSCAARLARRENVTFHASPAAARAAGFRPCRRCRPEDPPRAERDAAVIARACRHIEEAETPPRLNTLADGAGLSPHHFHRLFRKVTGVTPKAYATAHRAARLRGELAAGASVTEALYGAGFNAPSRLYAAAGGVLGMKPKDYRNGGAAAQIRFAVGETSLGAILVAATDKGVCAITLGDDPEALVRDLEDRFPKAELIGADAGFEATVAAAINLVERPASGWSLPLDIRGAAFQQKVWQALRAIPAGETRSYAEVAKAINAEGAHRAVAKACSENAIAVAVPCHRVVRKDGALSGYRWGVERKAALLAREGAR
jgi:AraC family transcriptional regulator of adaptative response/methylated-DNA-[protein]-cysteine methyltransferase